MDGFASATRNWQRVSLSEYRKTKKALKQINYFWLNNWTSRQKTAKLNLKTYKLELVGSKHITTQIEKTKSWNHGQVTHNFRRTSLQFQGWTSNIVWKSPTWFKICSYLEDPPRTCKWLNTHADRFCPCKHRGGWDPFHSWRFTGPWLIKNMFQFQVPSLQGVFFHP